MVAISDAKLAMAMIGNDKPTMAMLNNGKCEHRHVHYAMVIFDDGWCEHWCQELGLVQNIDIETK